MTSPLNPGHLSLPEQVATVLGQRIVQGLYAPGDILPGTDELIGEFGVSRPVIREAMKILHSKGLVESRQKVGTWARARQHWAMLDRDVLGWQLADPETNLSLLGSLQGHRSRLVGCHPGDLDAVRAVQLVDDRLQVRAGARGEHAEFERGQRLTGTTSISSSAYLPFADSGSSPSG